MNLDESGLGMGKIGDDSICSVTTQIFCNYLFVLSRRDFRYKKTPLLEFFRGSLIAKSPAFDTCVFEVKTIILPAYTSYNRTIGIKVDQYAIRTTC